MLCSCEHLRYKRGGVCLSLYEFKFKVIIICSSAKLHFLLLPVCSVSCVLWSVV